jgi:hypothetical protein
MKKCAYCGFECHDEMLGCPSCSSDAFVSSSPEALGQSIFGCSTLFGPGDEGGRQTFEYGFDFGWTVQHRELPLPGVLQLVPIFELAGKTGLNKDEAGQNSLLGNAAFRLNLKAIGDVQPRLGVGYVFPLDNNARTEVHHGVIVSLVLDY